VLTAIGSTEDYLFLLTGLAGLISALFTKKHLVSKGAYSKQKPND
jgi:hypothetical protein